VLLAWEETRVLEGSAIGRLAAFARRSGDTRFVGSSTERTSRSLVHGTRLSRRRRVHQDAYRDAPPHPTMVAIETGRALNSKARLGAELRRRLRGLGQTEAVIEGRRCDRAKNHKR
jgi:hypothetical protein